MKKKVRMGLTAIARLLCDMDGCPDYVFNRFAYLL